MQIVFWRPFLRHIFLQEMYLAGRPRNLFFPCTLCSRKLRVKTFKNVEKLGKNHKLILYKRISLLS